MLEELLGRIHTAGKKPRKAVLRGLLLELCALRPFSAAELCQILGRSDARELTRDHLKLRMHAGLKNPTVLIVVDRVDLDTQITGTFTGADIPNLEKADTREKLQQLLAQDVRKIIITTIFKFGEAPNGKSGSLNDRSNIIALVDEAHRTQEGDLGRKMRESVQPSSGHGKLIWHSLGAKTIELIHQNVHVDAVRDDLDTLVLDADLLEAVLSNPDQKNAKEIEIKLKRRLRSHGGNPKFKQLSERLDALKDRFESGQINSVDFLKQLLEIAKETLKAEKEVPPEEDEDRGKAALTELFNEVKTTETPIMVERVVTDIDEIVRLVRFPGWQGTQAGEREVKKALRKALFKYKLHADEELFEKAYSYIRQYY
jgi:type I site-specific restriction-modification system R (restriction) subunit